MILIALGANLPSRFGPAFETLQTAKKVLSDRGVFIASESRTWLTAPVPVSDQPWYHNEVIRVETSLSAFALLELLQEIESDFGRVRTVRNAPRVLDLDLIAYHDEIIDKPELIVPHPRMHERAFVLLPMKEVAAQWLHPVSKVTLDDLILHLPAGQQATPMDEKDAA